MTTPATANTPYRVINDAMFESGLLGMGRPPNSEHLAMYTNKLNDLFNYLQVKGLKLWLNYDFPVTLIAGQGGSGNPYTFGPAGNIVMVKPLRALEGYYVDSNNNSRPLIPLARSDWDLLSTRTNQGSLNSFYVDKQQLTLNVYTWLVPDAQAATGYMHLILQQQVGGVISLVDNLNFPIEWFLALKWNLAAQICTSQPQAVIDRCTAWATKTLDDLEAWDVEDASTSFAPDTRTMVSVGRFR